MNDTESWIDHFFASLVSPIKIFTFWLTVYSRHPIDDYVVDDFK